MSSVISGEAGSSMTTEMISGVHQLPADCYPPTDSDDESFVVLEPCAGVSSRPDSPQLIKPEIIASDVIDRSIEYATETIKKMSESSVLSSLVGIPSPPSLVGADNMNIASIISVSSDLGSQEVQERVVQLIDENAQLKETLHQTNLAMKNQYETLVNWQLDVEKVVESHKKKFADAKGYIKELQNEQIMLKKSLEAQKEETDMLSRKLLNERAEKSVSFLNGLPDSDEEKVNSLKILLENEKANKEKMITEMKETMDTAMIAFENEKTDKEEVIADLKESLTKTEITKDKEIQSLKNANENITQKINILMEDLKEKENDIVRLKTELSSAQQTRLQFTNEAIKLTDEQDEKEIVIAELKESMTKTLSAKDKELQFLKSSNENMDYKINKLIEDLREKENNLFTMKTELSKAVQTKLTTEQDHIKEISDLKNKIYELHKNLGEVGEIDSLRTRLNESNITIALLTDRLHALEFECEANRKRNDELDNNIKVLTIENDRMLILEEQMNEYKQDFELERKDKCDLITERNKLTEDLLHIKNRNDELTRELEVCRGGGTIPTSSQQQPTTPSCGSCEGNESPSSPLSIYECPICNWKFESLELLQGHAETCGTID